MAVEVIPIAGVAQLSPGNRFASFTPEEATMIYTGLVEAIRVAPGWQGLDVYERLKAESAEAVNAAIERIQSPQGDPA